MPQTQFASHFPPKLLLDYHRDLTTAGTMRSLAPSVQPGAKRLVTVDVGHNRDIHKIPTGAAHKPGVSSSPFSPE